MCIVLNSASIMNGVQGTTLTKAALGPRSSKCMRLVKGHPHPHKHWCTIFLKGTVAVTFPAGWTCSQPTTLLTKLALPPTPYPVNQAMGNGRGSPTEDCHKRLARMPQAVVMALQCKTQEANPRYLCWLSSLNR